MIHAGPAQEDTAVLLRSREDRGNAGACGGIARSGAPWFVMPAEERRG